MSAPSCRAPGTWMLVSLLLVRGIGVGAAAQPQGPPQASPQVPPPPAAASAPAPPPASAPADATTKELERLLTESAVAYKENRSQQGRELAETALALATRQGLPLYEAEALLRLGKDDAWFERHEAARDKFERSRALFQQVGNRRREAAAEMYLGTELRATDEHSRGVELVKHARATFRELGDALGVCHAGEWLMFMMGPSPEKDRLREEVLADIRAQGLKVTECNIQQEWGDELFTVGRYAEAYTRITEAVSCFEQTDDLGRTGRALVSLGRLERVHGQLDKALDNYTRALALQDRAHDVPAALQSLNAMAVTLGIMGRGQEAEARYLEAIARARDGAPHLVNTLSGNLGGLYLAQARYKKAADLLAESRAREKRGLMYAVRTRQLSWVYQQLGRSSEAVALADEAVKLAANQGPEQRVHALKGRADIMRELGRLDRARQDLAEALRIVDDLRRQSVPADVMRRGFGETTQLLSDTAIEVLLAAKDGRTALATSEQARSRAFLDRLAARDGARATAGAPAGPADDASPGAAVPAAASVTGTAPSSDEHSKSGAPPRVDASAAVAAPAVAASVATAAPASVADIQALAARLRSTWLIFWVGQTATTVWVVQPSGAVHWRRVPIPAAELETLVAQSVPRGSGLDSLAAMSLASRAHLRPWRELYRRLLLPVSAYLPSTPGSRLTIVPHGPLFRLSFAALQDEQGHYLLERYDLHYVPAAGVLQFTAAAHRHALARADGALLVGDPAEAGRRPAEDANGGSGAGTVANRIETDGQRNSRDRALPALGWARREVLSILALLPERSVALVGGDATETAVREGMAGRRIIHFATHGVVHNDASMTSYLAVSNERDGAGHNTRVARDAAVGRDAGAGREAGVGSDTTADGQLTADEIDHLTLDADLVVLSACGTALGPISGDGVQGFTRAFLSAGANSVIATTWSVADRTSFQVMERFYRGWLAGRSKSRALRQAQLDLLRQLRAGALTIDGVVLHESPWLWAGFILVGNP